MFVRYSMKHRWSNVSWKMIFKEVGLIRCVSPLHWISFSVIHWHWIIHTSLNMISEKPRTTRPLWNIAFNTHLITLLYRTSFSVIHWIIPTSLNMMSEKCRTVRTSWNILFNTHLITLLHWIYILKYPGSPTLHWISFSVIHWITHASLNIIFWKSSDLPHLMQHTSQYTSDQPHIIKYHFPWYIGSLMLHWILFSVIHWIIPTSLNMISEKHWTVHTSWNKLFNTHLITPLHWILYSAIHWTSTLHWISFSVMHWITHASLNIIFCKTSDCPHCMKHTSQYISD
jgi:hypothetical protein